MSTATQVHTQLFNATLPQLHQTWTEQGGEICGAQPDERGPIGGGSGYRDHPTTNHNAAHAAIRTLDELLDALAAARAGDVLMLDGSLNSNRPSRLSENSNVIINIMAMNHTL